MSGMPCRYLRYSSAVLIGLLPLISLTSCATPEAAPPTPQQQVKKKSEGRIHDVDGFPIYEGLLPDVSYTILGFVEVESVDSQRREYVFNQLKHKAHALGGNALIDLRRETMLETGETQSGQSLGVQDIGSFGSHAMITRYRWRATAILLQ